SGAAPAASCERVSRRLTTISDQPDGRQARPRPLPPPLPPGGPSPGSAGGPGIISTPSLTCPPSPSAEPEHGLPPTERRPPYRDPRRAPSTREGGTSDPEGTEPR